MAHISKFAYQQASSVPGEPVVKDQVMALEENVLKGPAEGPGEWHHFAQTTAPLLEHAAICSFALEVPTLSPWSCRSRRYMRMSLLAGCKTNTIAVSFAEKAYSLPQSKG
ncbi:hypothetical protein Zmor_012331 [Zophobas morio]|uniref:Uncharacterized protein n=1 Tax=Zophobas morio TaxID=2755281 RepID=A0AA38LZ78_9CUCU|nr:hypothetical protein Zmor_012331 [Zophobas morio]